MNSVLVGACQSFHFFRQNTWFLENNRVLSKFLYGILHYLISITKLSKNQSEKANFILTTEATLRDKIQSILFDIMQKKFFFGMLSNGCAWTLSLIKVKATLWMVFGDDSFLWSWKFKQHIKTCHFFLKLSSFYKHEISANRTQSCI